MALEIRSEKEENKEVIALKGRLDAMTFQDFQQILSEKIQVTTEDIIIDGKELEFVSSAGLRVLLMGQKELQEKQVQLVLRNMSSSVMKVLKMTGFQKILKIE